jgi:bacteriocin biosynthesis cyclodehydratase domain-containing protein
MTLLQIPPGTRIVSSGSNRIYWMTELDQGIWSSPHAGTLASLLATPALQEAVLGQFAAGLESGVAEQTLREMIAWGLVEPVSHTPSLTRLCHRLGVDPQHLMRNRWTEGAKVIALDPDGGRTLARTLASTGVPVSQSGGLRVVIVEDYLDARLDLLQRGFVAENAAWMPAKLAGEEVWIGPVFRPGATACWTCLAPRLRERRWLESQLLLTGPIPPERIPRNRTRAAASFAAEQAARWMLDGEGALEGAIWSFHWATMESRRHPVMRLPNCPDCGQPPQPRPIELRSVKVNWTPPGDLRTADPQSMAGRLDALTSPITGILHRLERCDLVSAPLISTYGAVYHVALPPPRLRIPGAILQPAVCSGRGWSPAEARAACLAEAVERYSLQFRGDEPRIKAACRDLGDRAIHPDTVQLFSDRQFSHREPWNARHSLDEAVPERFDETEEIEWTPGWSLCSGQPRLLPIALAAHYYRPAGCRWIGNAGSNGCAAGSCIEEAILHGIFELVERDALAIWWYNQISLPAFTPKCLSDAGCRRACAQLAEQGWSVWMQDITTDLKIPVIIAVAVSPDGRWIHGSSAHLHPATALRQAVCELWQLSQGRPRPLHPPAYSVLREQDIAACSLAERPVDLKTLAEECGRALERAGHEVIVFDIARPELDWPVVRVVAPGLRHHKPRFAPGRLYDVPVRLGWLPAPRAEHELPTVSP